VNASKRAPAHELAQLLLDAWLAERQRELGIVGVAGAFVLPGGAVVSAAHGSADIERSAGMSPDTPLRVASVTKMFTLTAILIARDEGLLSLDAPASDLVPELASVSSPAVDPAPITLRQIVSHTAGLPHDLPYGVEYWTRSGTDVAFPPAEDARKHLRGLRLIAPPMSSYHYSNVGFMVAGLALEAAFGVPYEQVIRTRILAPLGMEDSFFWPTEAHGTLARGYRLEGSTIVVAPNLDVRWDTPGGGLCSSALDLTAFIKLHLTDRAPGGAQVLGGSSVKEARQPVFMLPGWRAGIGLGWRMRQADGETLLSHSGGIAGFSAYLALIPSLDIGGVLLTNTSGKQAHLQMLLEGMLESVATVVKIDDDTSRLNRESAVETSLAELTGHYTTPESSCDVIAVNGRLAIVSRGDLDHADWIESTGEWGRFIGGPGYLQGEPVAFTKSADGRTTELMMQGMRFHRS
jgi:CubicO group peptidase (beta-lactamase class C family)